MAKKVARYTVFLTPAVYTCWSSGETLGAFLECALWVIFLSAHVCCVVSFRLFCLVVVVVFITVFVVLQALKTPGAHPVHKATIMPRGQALGYVMQLPEGDQTSMSRKQV